MINFLLQLVNNQVRHDFVLEMINAVEYHNWREPNSMGIYYAHLNDLEQLKNDNFIGTCIPIGTIEFVYKFIDIFIKPNGSKEIHPLNVPYELNEYTYTKRIIEDEISLNDWNRNDWYKWLKDDALFDIIFIKSNDIIKSSINGFYKNDDIFDKNLIPNGNYQLSECINIISEYRCFIYNNDLKGIQYYSGDFTIFPDINIIYEMIDVFSKSAPKAYTLDVAITDDKNTVVVEAHEFFSCGLYGFSDYQHLPYMFKRTFDDIKKRIVNG